MDFEIFLNDKKRRKTLLSISFLVLREICLLNIKLGQIRILQICIHKSLQNMVKRVHVVDHI